MSDWFEEWHARLAAGDRSPLPYDPAWWEVWEEAVREAPGVAESESLSADQAKAKPASLFGGGR